MLASCSPKFGIALGFVFCTQKLEILCFCGNFNRFFSNLGKTRENLKMDGEESSRNKDIFSC